MNTALLAASVRPAFPQPGLVLHRDGTASPCLNHDLRPEDDGSYRFGRQPFSYRAIQLWAQANGKTARIETVAPGHRAMSIFDSAGRREYVMRGVQLGHLQWVRDTYASCQQQRTAR